MTRDALSTRTGWILGAATALLAVTGLGLTIGSTPHARPEPRYTCVEPMAASPLIISEAIPDRLPGSCHRYIVTVRQFAGSNCPPLPENGRQALLDAVHQMETAWREIPESSMPALADACRSANEALDEAVLHMCPQMIRK